MSSCTEHILLVEDNPDDVTLTKRAMKKAGIVNPIQVAEDGARAVELLLGPDAGPLPALVLLDLKLPKMDGLEVLRVLRSDPRTELLPIVVLTTSSEQRDLIRSYRLRANSYIRKPVSFAEFVQTVGQMGVYWLILNQAPARSLGD
jgi:two-component system response regulator